MVKCKNHYRRQHLTYVAKDRKSVFFHLACQMITAAVLSPFWWWMFYEQMQTIFLRSWASKAEAQRPPLSSIVTFVANGSKHRTYQRAPCSCKNWIPKKFTHPRHVSNLTTALLSRVVEVLEFVERDLHGTLTPLVALENSSLDVVVVPTRDKTLPPTNHQCGK